MRSLTSLPFSALGCAVAGALLQMSCLIGPPEDLTPPERIAPRALVDQADPTVLAPVQTRTAEPFIFRVPFVSEDLGEPVVGRLFLNYNSEPAERDLGSNDAPPGTLDDVREMVVPWNKNTRLAEGCYSVTMTITHNDNYSPVTLAPIDFSRTAMVTWWVVHDLQPHEVNLNECFPPPFPAR